MGHHNRVFNNDRYALSGAWSPPTSKANFCEEDYAFSYHLAELINSLTNLTYIFFALRSVFRTTANGKKQGLDFMSFSLIVLGACSFLYHATMRQTMQFADDLSMLFMSWSLLQGVLTSPGPGPFTKKDIWITIGLGALFTGFSTFYVYTGEIVYHTAAFILCIVAILGRCHYLFTSPVVGLDKVKARAWEVRSRWALAWLLAGYGLWNVDLEFCEELRQLRGMVGAPWGWGLELHGWWHILTAVAADRTMWIIRELREELAKEGRGQGKGKDE